MNFMKIEDMARIIADKLKYRDFTRSELNNVLKDLYINLTDDRVEQLIDKLSELGFSCEEGFDDFDYSGVSVELDHDIDSELEKNKEEKFAPYYDSSNPFNGISSGLYSNNELLNALAADVAKKVDKMGIKVDEKSVYDIIQKVFEHNPEFYKLARSINYMDQKRLLDTLCDYYLVHQNYLISLVNVKATDARLIDLATSLQAKESSEKVQSTFSNKYPETNIIENQVNVQDANNTLATAALNMAMEELGSNATPEAIRTRSLEILEEEKSNQPKKGSM